MEYAHPALSGTPARFVESNQNLKIQAKEIKLRSASESSEAVSIMDNCHPDRVLCTLLVGKSGKHFHRKSSLF